jgi:hypothetical protein
MIQESCAALESGASSAGLQDSTVKKLCATRDAHAEWTVAAGELSASEHCKICLQQHAMSPTLGAEPVIHLTKSLHWHEVILSSDLLGGRGLGLDVENILVICQHAQL